MGAAVPYAIGAKFAHPDRPVVALVGDGAMQMNNMAELITIAKYYDRWPDKRLVVCVFNNEDLNEVTWEQRVMNAGGEGDVGVCARNADAAGLERLTKRIEHWTLELGQFVEEQHAEVREADLARTDPQAAADQRRHRGTMVRRAERPAAPDPATAKLARDRRHHRDFKRLARLQRRQDARKARSKQRLARAGRSAHQQIVAAGRSDFERALGDFLSLDLGEVGTAFGRFRFGLRPARAPATCP